MKLVPCFVAFASIACTKQYNWDWMADNIIPDSVLDNQTPTVRYAVHVELAGQPFIDLRATLQANVFVTARSPASGTAMIELRSLTHGDEDPAKLTTDDITSRYSHFLAIDALLACRIDPCDEDYEVIVQRDPTSDLPPIDITGLVTVVAWANKAPPGGGAEVSAMLEP